MFGVWVLWFQFKSSDLKFIRETFSWDNRKWCMNQNIWLSIWTKCYSPKFTFSIVYFEWFGSLIIRLVFSICTIDGVSVGVPIFHLIFRGLTHIRAMIFVVVSRNHNTLFGIQFNDKNDHSSLDDYSFQ